MDDARALRQVGGSTLGREPVPDETPIGQLRHRLEAPQRGPQLFARIGEDGTKQGLPVSRGTRGEAPILRAPSSMTHQAKARDPERHPTKTGPPWALGRTVPMGGASQRNVLDAVAAPAATGPARQVVPQCVPGQETPVGGEAASSGHPAVIRPPAPQAQRVIQPLTHRHRPRSDEARAKTRTKSKGRVKGDHAVRGDQADRRGATGRSRGRAQNPHGLPISGGVAKRSMVRRLGGGPGDRMGLEADRGTSDEERLPARGARTSRCPPNAPGGQPKDRMLNEIGKKSDLP